MIGRARSLMWLNSAPWVGRVYECDTSAGVQVCWSEGGPGSRYASRESPCLVGSMPVCFFRHLQDLGRTEKVWFFTTNGTNCGYDPMKNLYFTSIPSWWWWNMKRGEVKWWAIKLRTPCLYNSSAFICFSLMSGCDTARNCGINLQLLGGQRTFWNFSKNIGHGTDEKGSSVAL